MIVIVDTDYTFTEFDRFDPLLHYARGDIALYHWQCEGGGKSEVEIQPTPYQRRLLMGWQRHDFHDAPEVYQLVCGTCGESVQHIGDVVRMALKRFLVGPEPETAPAQPLGGGQDRFVPPGWPPKRRHRPDRRKVGGRYLKDRTMEGHRRRDRDRRADPDRLDSEPGS